MRNIRKQIEWKTGIPMDNINKLINSYQKMDLSDEYYARKFMKQIGRQTGMPIPKEVQNRIVPVLMKRGRKK
ncbi:stage VI sporulation protein F [Aquibacillus koreensis]|uniref:Stage VI sporulation protein F n=1 Tax=Aquibacillus koreensis TaxID=279446 RepID=A0A9X3WJK1_9BACI|nr:stage VI sporulation protein F [Aquibacillus koreensis]MCT2536407.1 stage VI sporulation protein F [Aquibacillus koreensis]MDC3421242.1 stage VI sporulation protein F [Aquibacillus koreensis]